MSELRLWKNILLLAAVALMVFLVVHIWHILIPFVIGLVIAYLVHPLTDRFVAMGLRRDRIVLVLYVLLFSVIAVAALFLIPRLIREAQGMAERLPEYTAAFDSGVDRLNQTIRGVLQKFIGKKGARFAIPIRAEVFVDSLLVQIPNNILSLAHVGLWIFIIPFVSFFALTQGRHWIDLLFDVTPSHYVESLLGLLAEVNATLGAFVRGQVLDALCVGFLTMIGLWALGFNGAVLVGSLTGLLNLVPFLAPIVGGTIALTFGYFQGLGFSSLFGILLLFAVVRLLDDFVFMPFIVGNSVDIHPVVVLLAILAGYDVAGFLGLVFAVPATAVLKVVLSSLLHRQRDNSLFHHQKVIS